MQSHLFTCLGWKSRENANAGSGLGTKEGLTGYKQALSTFQLTLKALLYSVFIVKEGRGMTLFSHVLWGNKLTSPSWLQISSSFVEGVPQFQSGLSLKVSYVGGLGPRVVLLGQLRDEPSGSSLGHENIAFPKASGSSRATPWWFS